MDKNTKVKKILKRNIIYICITVIILALLGLLGFLVYNHLKEKEPDPIIKGEVPLYNVTGKLKEYIESLGDSYYIRYTGEFGSKDLNTNLVQGTLEYSRRGIETAIVCKEIDMRVVTDDKNVYNVSEKHKMILKAKLPILFDTEEYNLISDFGQIYIADVTTEVADVEYIYQEYEYKGAKIRYYFVGDDLRYIRIVTGDKDRKINIRVDRHANQSLFDVPTEYNIQNI